MIDQQYPQWPYQSGKNYPCNGPFQLKMNQPHQGYQLIKNPLYWESNKLKLDQVILTTMNPAQALDAFQKKEVDWVGNPFGAWQASYNIGKKNQILTFPNTWVIWNVYNVTVPPFNHRKIRQAFSCATQRSPIAQQSFMPLDPAYSIFLPHNREKNSGLFPQYDRELAVQLFHEGLHELGIPPESLPPLSIVFLETGIQAHIAHCLKEQFEDCFKISCVLESLPWSALFNRMTKGHFQMGLACWNSWVNDPIYAFKVFKYKNNKLNFSQWEHSQFQHLMDFSEQEITPFQRSQCLHQAEQLLSEETPITPLFFQSSQALINEELHVVYRSPSGPFNAGRSFYTLKNS